MRRADRLFQIVQLLRRDRCTTAARLAAELEVSERTIYRDIQDLLASGVPIEGEAGVGYRVARGFELPPLAFTLDEVEALVAGMRMVAAWTDPVLKAAALAALRKVEAVLPEGHGRLDDLPILAPDFLMDPKVAHRLAELRAAVRERRKVRVAYQRKDGQGSERVLQPLGLAFWGGTWTLAAWCELRRELRTFRLDRIGTLEVLEDRFEPGPGRTLADYLAVVAAE